jgi:cytoskeletal protein CcmA (bactofilin family)
VAGYTEFYNNVVISRDLTTQSTFFVYGDSSLNGNLYVNRHTILQDVSINGNVTNMGSSVINGDVSLNGRLRASNIVLDSDGFILFTFGF